MKKTLYEILGVDPKASKSEIEAAYGARIDELKFATLQDPNKLRVLQQSKEILSDPNQRATYDASISLGGAPEPAPEPQVQDSSLLGRWGKWIAAGALLTVAGIWWAHHGMAPRPQPPPTPQASARVEPAAAPAPVVAVEATAPPVQNDAARSAPEVPTPPDTTINPMVGEWSCEDALTGHTSKYNFQQNGSLSIATGNAQLLDYQYELQGKVLKVTDARQSRVFTIEELLARKMILNLGGAGQRVVCKR